MHLHRTPASASLRRALSIAVASVATLALAACGNQYRPVVSSINPVGPAGQPTKYAIAISNTSTAQNPNSPGLVTFIDVSGDTVLNTTLIGVNPRYFQLASTGFEGYTLNGDGTLTSFAISTSLLASQVLETTLFPGSNPVSISSAGTNLYIPEQGRSAIAQLANLPPAVQQELPSGANPYYVITNSSASRAYALVQGSGTPANGIALPIETATTLNTLDTPIPVGSTPVYGLMTADTRRAFVINKGSNNVTVINSQANALDNFNATGTIAVGTAPVWADFAPSLNELLVLNQGNATSPCPDGVTLGCGSVSVINIPLCSSATVVTNPNCDAQNPVDAVGFGTVIATIPVGVNPVMISVLQDGTQAFVANSGAAATQGNPASCVLPAAGRTPNCSVSVINLATDSVVATIPFINSNIEGDSYGHGHPNWIGSTTGTPTGKAYATAGDSTDITIMRSQDDTVATHLTLQGYGVSVRLNAQ